MIHPFTELKYLNEVLGYGVVATSDIPRGTIMWVMDRLDRVFSERQVQEYGPEYRETLAKYCFRDNRGRHVLCWDLARYVNHSFSPNCLTTAYDFELAVRDIQKGEQITNHYGYLNLDPMVLMTEDGDEQIMVTPEEFFNHAEKWDGLLAEAFSKINDVTQPLERFLSPKMKKQIEEVHQQNKKLDSILECYFDREQYKARRRRG